MLGNSYLFYGHLDCKKGFVKTRIKRRKRKRENTVGNEKAVPGNKGFCLFSLSIILLGIIMWIYNRGVLDKHEIKKKPDKNKKIKYSNQ